MDYDEQFGQLPESWQEAFRKIKPIHSYREAVAMVATIVAFNRIMVQKFKDEFKRRGFRIIEISLASALPFDVEMILEYNNCAEEIKFKMYRSFYELFAIDPDATILEADVAIGERKSALSKLQDIIKGKVSQLIARIRYRDADPEVREMAEKLARSYDEVDIDQEEDTFSWGK